MTGVSIFVHAVKMVLNNLGPALRIGVVPILVMAVSGWFFGSGFTPGTEGGPDVLPDANAFGRGVVALVVSLLMSLWVAVAWHRYILLEEEPGAIMPNWNGGAIWAYFKAAVVLALIMIVAALPLTLLGGFVLFASVAENGPPGLVTGFLFFLLVGLPLTWLGYRLGASLAGAATDAPLSLGDSWRATAPGAADLAVLALVSVVALWLPSTLVAELPAALAIPLGALVNWAATMIGVGVITTIYGHYVQGRALNA